MRNITYAWTGVCGVDMKEILQKDSQMLENTYIVRSMTIIPWINSVPSNPTFDVLQEILAET